ncbi:Rho-related GTP-binding protein RhoH [Frankliniella fusca]|uniref:Rho-related GTP-binding protein RhoH n=1 Tax=Frankliniella fusca TaxID=407009 RepID=A0AAE1HYZ6_9NEOP|nr:Rho-related GTP-binding protein RhoH [Frankliniella fusca]
MTGAQEFFLKVVNGPLTGQMINFIHFYEQRIDYVMVNQFKIFMSNPMFYISFTASKEVVNHNYFMTFHHQTVNKMRSNKPSTTYPVHCLQTSFYQVNFGLPDLSCFPDRKNV